VVHHPACRQYRVADSEATRWRFPAATVILAVAFLLCRPALSQETVDPRTGGLSLVVTDLVVSAGVVELEATRWHLPHDPLPGPLGIGWRPSWGSELHAAASEAVILEGPVAIAFRTLEGDPDLWSATGERLTLESPQRAIRLDAQGWTSVYELHEGVGRLFERSDHYGNQIRWTYSADGALARIDGPRGSYLEFSADAAGRVIRIAPSFGSKVEYGYDGDWLTQVRVDGELTERYSYDESGSLIAIERPESGSVELAYDSRGRVIGRRWADGSSETHAYDDSTRTYRLTDVTGGVTVIVWSEDWRRETLTDANGNITVTEFDADLRPVAVTDAVGVTTRLIYDESGRVVRFAEPGGRTTSVEYHGSSSLPSTVQRSDGTTETYEYDVGGSLLAEMVDGEVARRYTYYPDGLIESVEGIDVPKIRFTYLPNGLLDTETNALGQVSRYRYDDRGNLVSFTDAAGNTARWRYSERGRMVSVTDAAGAMTIYSYDERGLLVAITDPTGAVTRFVYDARGRLVTEVDPLGRTTSYELRPDGQLSRVVDPAGHAERFEYDAAGRMIREINPLGGVTEYAYDSLGSVVAVSEPGGTSWTYQYATDGQLTGIENPSGFRKRFVPSAHRQEFVDPAGRLTSDLYDPLGQLTERRLPTGILERYRNDATGNLVEISTDTGLRTAIDRDPLGRPLRVALPTGLEVSYIYDGVGNLVRIEDSLGVGAGMRHDPVGRVTEVVEADGATARYRYDAAGRLLEQIDPLGYTTGYAYDAAGQLTRITGPEGEAIRFEYDAAGWLAAIHHPGNVTTSFVRDALGNAVRITDPLGQTVEREFDSAGRLVRESDPEGRVTSMVYDEAGRFSHKTRPDEVTVTYTYDGSGNLVGMDDGSFPVRYSYDERGNQTGISYPSIERSLSFNYDERDRLLRFVDSEGRAVRYRYDAFDRVAGIVTEEGDEITITYDADDRPIVLSYPNGISEVWRYDTAGRPVEIAYRNRSGDRSLLRSYTYAANGNPMEVSGDNALITRYRYDRSGQLVAEDGPEGSHQYRYLADGNRASLIDGAATIEYRYDSGGRLVQAGDESFRYDARGNMVERRGPEGTTRYAFDAEDRLVSAVLPDGETIRFGYAPSGERIWREDAAGRTWFISDGDHRLADLDASLRLVTSYLHGPWLDRPLMVSSRGDRHWFLRDALGSVVGLCDSSGTLTAEYRTDAFGNELLSGLDRHQPFGFTAREYEPKLGLYFYRARFYDPRLGRFISADPLWARVTDALSANRYVYVRNAPTRYIDPMGLRAEKLWLEYGLPPPPPDRSVTQRVRGLAKRYGTTAKDTAKLVLEEFEHLRRLNSLRRNVPDPRRLPHFVRRRPSLHRAVERVQEQLELNRLFHRPGVDPRSPSSSIEGARRFLDLERQKEIGRAVAGMRRVGHTPPRWAVKPNSKVTVYKPHPGAETPSSGTEPSPSTGAGGGSGVDSGSGSGGSGGGTPGGGGSGGAGTPGAASGPRVNPNFRGSPSQSETNANWKRIPKTPPRPTPAAPQGIWARRWAEYTKPPTTGQSITLTVTLTAEMVLRCRSQGLTVAKCAEQFVKGVRENWKMIAGVTAITVFTPAGPVVLTALTLHKGVTDIMQYYYQYESASEARLNLERILKNRKMGADLNLELELDPKLRQMREKIEVTAATLRSACKSLEIQAYDAAQLAGDAGRAVHALGSPETIARDAPACRDLADSQTRLETRLAECRTLRGDLSANVEAARTRLSACRGADDAELATSLLDRARSASKRLDQLAAEARTLVTGGTATSAAVADARRRLSEAREVQDRVNGAIEKLPQLETINEEVQLAEQAEDLLTEPAPSLYNDIDALTEAFGDLPTMDSAVEYKFWELKQLVRSFEAEVRACRPAELQATFVDAADRLVRAKLDIQNFLSVTDEVGNCEVAELIRIEAEIRTIAEDARRTGATADELSELARQCAALELSKPPASVPPPVVEPPRAEGPTASRLFLDPPRVSITAGESTGPFKVWLIYSDGSSAELDTRSVWWEPTGGPSFTFAEAGLHSVTVRHRTRSGTILQGSATVDVAQSWTPPAWEPPISGTEDRDADVPVPGPADYTWFALCDPRSGQVSYGENPDLVRHRIIGGPFPGPRTAKDWIDKSCPSWRCTQGGGCATGPRRGGDWAVVCSKAHGGISLIRNPDPTRFWIFSSGLYGEPDARLWVNQRCPSWRCDREGRCLPGVRRRDDPPLEVPPEPPSGYEDVPPVVRSSTFEEEPSGYDDLPPLVRSSTFGEEGRTEGEPDDSGRTTSKRFDAPMWGGARLDNCKNLFERDGNRTGIDCGEPAASEYCRSMGFDRAANWDIEEVEKTSIMMGGECQAAMPLFPCGGFKWIDCVKEGDDKPTTPESEPSESEDFTLFGKDFDCGHEQMQRFDSCLSSNCSTLLQDEYDRCRTACLDEAQRYFDRCQAEADARQDR